MDVRAVLFVHRRGHGDPAFAVDQAGAIWRACRTPDGAGTLRVAWRSVPSRAHRAHPHEVGRAQDGSDHATDGSGHLQDGSGRAQDGSGRAQDGSGRAVAEGRATLVHAAAWGAGAAWLLAALPGLLGAEDTPEGFAPEDPLMRGLVRQHPGLRIGRSGLVLEALVPAVLEQKVVGMEATRAWRLLLWRFGEPAPGPVPRGMRIPPAAQTWAAIPSWEWHRAGVEAVRARTIAAAARVAGRLEEIVATPSEAADRRLRALPGIGPWTSAEVRQRACGDADAVSVGDYHLPAIVGLALAGRAVDDAGMLELLAPYRGHRHRAATLAGLSGARRARRGPRMAVRDYRAL